MSELPKEYLKTILKNICRSKGVDPESTYSIREHNFRLWVSSVYRVTVHSNPELYLFFKCLPESEELRKTFNLEKIFSNEISFYKNVLEPMLKFQEKKKVKNPFCAVPTCYYTQSDGENDVLVLEDLNPKGYIMLDRHKLMGISELHLLMKELGKFHALSLAVKHQEPENFRKMRSSIKEMLFNKDSLAKYTKLYEYVGKDVVNLAKHHFPHDSFYVKKLMQYENIILDRMIELATPKEEDEVCNVITHADLWVNNFLFHYPEGFSEPDMMKILDFQAVRYGPPALDVTCILLSSADKKIRDEHQDSLLHSYHDSLSEFLKELGSDPKQLFPFQTLQNQLKKYSEFGLWMTVVNVPLTLDVGASVDENYSSSVEESGNDGDDFISSLKAMYKRKTKDCITRVLDVIKEVIDNGCI